MTDARGMLLLIMVCVCLVMNGSSAMNDQETREFFELINLEYPGLEAVKAALDLGHYTEAKEALVAYYRTREHPGWYVKEPPEGGLYPSLDSTTADDVIARRFTISSKSAQMDKKIDWAYCPYGDREWTWLLNRHTYFLPLGRAYLRTGDEKYAADFDFIITDWILSNPVPDRAAGLPHSWRTLEAGIRMFNSWHMAWNAFKDSPSFTTDARILMLKSFAEHADYLMKFTGSDNRLLMEIDGLLHVGALFPEFKDAPKWRQTALQRLVEQMEYQVLPDGAQYELTTSYHSISTWNFLHATILKRIADGIELPPSYYERLRKMLEFSAGITRPDGKAPMINDADQHDLLGRVQEPAKALGADQIPELRPLMEIKPPSHSVFFPNAGIACMRTGNRPQDLYLMLDAGPFGAGHQHEDKLNLEVYAYGRPFVVDPGRFSYTGEGAAFKASAAHNLILVDGKGQHRRGTDRSKWVAREPVGGVRWITEEGYDYAEGIYDEGFGNENELPVTHRRRIFFVKPEYWIVVDVLEGDGDHMLEQLWHFVPGELRVGDGFACTANQDEANLAIVRPDGANVRVVCGETTPILGYYSPKYNVREPSPTAVFGQTSTLPTAIETVVYPSRGGSELIVPELSRLHCLVDGQSPREGSISAISIRLPSYEDVFVMCHDPALAEKPKRFLDFEFVGEAVWIRIDAQGRVTKVMSLPGGKLLRDEKAVETK